jgi:peptidoglycan/LPS O-acetylase OafA/YrhL
MSGALLPATSTDHQNLGLLRPALGSSKLASGSPQGRIPSLDGCRAISVFLVLFGHACETKNLDFSRYLPRLGQVATLGVTVFFVISGYLITSLLLEEERRHGRISLSMFYLRRAFRIWPVAYAYIAVVAALQAAGALTLPRYNLLYAATFTMNLAPQGSWWLGHLWSLAVEEQFYFVWPAVFLFTRGRWRLVL